LKIKKARQNLDFFQPEKLDSGKTLSDLHTHCQFLLTRVHDHAGCKEFWKGFTVTLKMFDVFNKKQMYDHVITGNENASKD